MNTAIIFPSDQISCNTGTKQTCQLQQAWLTIQALRRFYALSAAIGMAICYQFERAYFPATVTIAASAAQSGVTPLILQASNTTNQVQQQVVQFLQFHPKIMPETISEGQKSKIFLGDHAPRPPQKACCERFNHILEPPFPKFQIRHWPSSSPGHFPPPTWPRSVYDQAACALHQSYRYVCLVCSYQNSYQVLSNCSVKKMQGWGFASTLTVAFMHHPYLVCILFGMPSYIFYIFNFFYILVSILF